MMVGCAVAVISAAALAHLWHCLRFVCAVGAYWGLPGGDNGFAVPMVALRCRWLAVGALVPLVALRCRWWRRGIAGWPWGLQRSLVAGRGATRRCWAAVRMMPLSLAMLESLWRRWRIRGGASGPRLQWAPTLGNLWATVVSRC